LYLSASLSIWPNVSAGISANLCKILASNAGSWYSAGMPCTLPSTVIIHQPFADLDLGLDLGMDLDLVGDIDLVRDIDLDLARDIDLDLARDSDLDLLLLLCYFH
jgi:hypothetical protein